MNGYVVIEYMTISLLYKVAAIFPERFQSFTVALKNNLFYYFFSAKPSQLFTET